MNTIRVSYSLDPDQARRSVGPDIDPNCLQRSVADDKILLSVWGDSNPICFAPHVTS